MKRKNRGRERAEVGGGGDTLVNSSMGLIQEHSLLSYGFRRRSHLLLFRESLIWGI